MLRIRASVLAAALIGLTSLVGQVSAQTTFPNVKLSGRLHEQFYYFGNEDYAATTGSRSNFFTRRARIEAKGQINEYVSVYIQPSFEGGRAPSSSSCSSTLDTLTSTVSTKCTNGNGGIRLRDAWVDVRLSKPEAPTAFTIRFGQEKRPFSRYELTSSNNLPTIERGAGKGLVGVASNNLFEGAGFLSHDVGVHARVEHKLDNAGRMASLLVGVYNGRGESLNDNNDAKSIGVRAYADIYQKLSIGGSFFSHDAILGADSSFRNSGYDIDAAWSKPGEEGLYVEAEYLGGKDAKLNTAGDKISIRGIQALAAYHIRMKSPTSWLYAIEPAVRFDTADPDTDVDNNGSTLITAVLGFYISSKAQFRVAYENQSFQATGAKSISGVRTAMTVNF